MLLKNYKYIDKRTLILNRIFYEKF